MKIIRIVANAFNQKSSIKQITFINRIYSQLERKGGMVSEVNISAKKYITNEKQATQRDTGREAKKKVAKSNIPNILEAFPIS